MFFRVKGFYLDSSRGVSPLRKLMMPTGMRGMIPPSSSLSYGNLWTIDYLYSINGFIPKTQRARLYECLF